jgi:hypothetical protein
MDIIRTPSEIERKDFIPISDPSKVKKTIKELFEERLNEEMQKALKKELPFCDRACRDDFNDGYKQQAEKSLRLNGYVKSEDIKPVEIVWEKYSDLNNFELLEEGETYDEFLTRRNPGLTVMAKKKVYKFKGYSNKYTVMESGPDSIARARLKLKELNN